MCDETSDTMSKFWTATKINCIAIWVKSHDADIKGSFTSNFDEARCAALLPLIAVVWLQLSYDTTFIRAANSFH